ncbi:hypothetical protein CVT24_012541 [Panaeolus cyanescens]|uniref:Uncharacterized protein n=1 Tax=Panaeolus cyanescens TaxID=181874 RepID=A0A409WK90_9AGAR|nr:hypothetical protein CVT24_012541 [Panaeolus cyanescens]
MSSEHPPLSSLTVEINWIGTYLTLMAEDARQWPEKWPSLFALLKLIFTPVIRNTDYREKHKEDLAKWPLNVAQKIFVDFCKTKKVNESFWKEVLDARSQISAAAGGGPSGASATQHAPPAALAPSRPKTLSKIDQEDGGSRSGSGSGSGKQKHCSTGSTITEQIPQTVQTKKRVNKKAHTVDEEEVVENTGMDLDFDDSEGMMEDDEVEVVKKGSSNTAKAKKLRVEDEDDEVEVVKKGSSKGKARERNEDAMEVDSSEDIDSSEEVMMAKPRPKPRPVKAPQPAKTVDDGQGQPKLERKAAKPSGELVQGKKHKDQGKGKGKAVVPPEDLLSGSDY